jgi:hypothetical protein
MGYVVEVPVSDADAILVEVDDEAASGLVRSGRTGHAVLAATESFEAALDRFRPMAQALVSRFRDLADLPDQITIEFGIKLSVDAGLVIAHTASEAHFKVILQWPRP